MKPNVMFTVWEKSWNTHVFYDDGTFAVQHDVDIPPVMYCWRVVDGQVFRADVNGAAMYVCADEIQRLYVEWLVSRVIMGESP